MTRHDVVDNLTELTFTSAELKALLADFSRSIVVMAYQKYRPDEHNGLIPKVQVDLIRHTATTFEQFRSTIVRSTESLKKVLDGFELTEPPRVLQVGGRQAVLLNATFTIGSKNGGPVKARTRVYAVPIGNTFFQINFSDGPDDDCSGLFDTLVNTIRFE